MLGPAFVLVAQLFTNGLESVTIGDETLASASACMSCHAAEHAEWSGSRHANAYTNPIFQREYRARPEDWCVHCHAPLAAQLEEARAGGGPLTAEGVSCAACHVRKGRIIAARKRAGSPHDTDVRDDFGGASFCASCHQFNFPRFDETRLDSRTRVVGYTAHPMQNTVAEHADGERSGEACRSCHTSAAGHVYAGGHDPKMLERALSLAVCRDGTDVLAKVANRGAGHRVPTGDVHRHLALRLWRPSAPEKLREHFLIRRFRPVEDGGKEIVEDTSLPPLAAKTFRTPAASLGGEAREAIAVELRLVYTVDEFPLHELGEPAFTVVATQRARLRELPRCSGTKPDGVVARIHGPSPSP